MDDSKQNNIEKTWPGRWMSQEYEPGLVSVVIPTYNRAQLLLATLSSVAEQYYRPLEVIVSDDGSIDNTPDVTKAWSKSVENDNIDVRYIHFPNAGAPTARNRGMAESHGEFVQFLDSDCLLASEKISTQVRFLTEYPECDFTYCSTSFVTPKGMIEYQYGKPLDLDPMVNVIDGVFTSIAPLWRRSAIQDVQWTAGLPCLQDWVFKAHVLMDHPVGYYDSRNLCQAINHDGDHVTKHGSLDFVRGRLQAIRIVEDLIKNAPLITQAARDILGQRYLSIFKSALKLNDYKLAEEAILHAYRTGCKLRKMQTCYWPARILGLRLFRYLLVYTGYL